MQHREGYHLPPVQPFVRSGMHKMMTQNRARSEVPAEIAQYQKFRYHKNYVPVFAYKKHPTFPLLNNRQRLDRSMSYLLSDSLCCDAGHAVARVISFLDIAGAGDAAIRKLSPSVCYYHSRRSRVYMVYPCCTLCVLALHLSLGRTKVNHLTCELMVSCV